MIYLIRHGQTEFNAAGRYQGQSDSGLTDIGRAQAVAIAGTLAPLLAGQGLRVVASPLGRAAETAARVVAGLAAAGVAVGPVEHDPRLMEVGMGAWDGLTRAEIALRWPEARKGRGRIAWMFHGPGGESQAEVVARLAAALSQLPVPGRPTLAVSHGVVGRILRGLHAGMPVAEALTLDAPQNEIFALAPGGGISRIPAPEALPRASTRP